jgi:DNA primase
VQDTISCPFHDDSEPSCSINKDKGIFRCFGCETSGNVLDFVCHMEGNDPDDTQGLANGATYAITEILGKKVSDFGRKGKSNPKRRKKPAAAKKAARKKPKLAKASHEEKAGKKPTPEASEIKANPALTFELQNLVREHEFLDRRGISRDTARTFGLGLCERGIMKGRIVIPVHNASGELVAYAGRWPEEAVPEGTSRYRFPKNFAKSLELYNLHRALARLGGNPALIIVEGFWSAMRLHQHGFAAVAAFGHDLSEEQVRLIARHVDNAVLVFDGDEPGRKGMEKAAIALSQHVYTRTVFLPEGEKPDTMDVGKLRAI